jgi:tetratricopeptide (TPR) repeat protein
MIDPILFVLLEGKHPEISKNDDLRKKFKIAIDEVIKNRLDELLAEEEAKDIKFESLTVRRAHLEQEIRDSINFTEFERHITEAITILWKEGSTSLEKEEYSMLINGLFILKKNLIRLDLNELDDAKLQQALKLPTNCGELILKIALEKFNQGQYHESLSLLIFLTLVNPEDSDYWYRLGLVAQKCKNYPLALCALETTSELTPDFIGSHIFAAYCYLEMQSRENAVAELARAKNLYGIKMEEKWQQHLANIETLLKVA